MPLGKTPEEILAYADQLVDEWPFVMSNAQKDIMRLAVRTLVIVTIDGILDHAIAEMEAMKGQSGDVETINRNRQIGGCIAVLNKLKESV